jgi:hypothetical protein
MPFETGWMRASRRPLADAGRIAEAWSRLEVAHILSQAWWRPHVKVHWTMLRLAARTRDRHEILGQMIRLIVAGPGSVTGRYPVGNTGRANVSATQPMPVPEELAELLAS